ncbi:MAG: glucosylceramidase [Clostridia bacterium]|nr:glucosylceramidase [Clostridia bacterium]
MKCTWTITRWDGQKALTASQTIMSTEDQGQENQAMNIHPDFIYQTFEGFGGSLTESAAVTFAQMPAHLQKKALQAYYGKDGLGYNIARMHIDSCDFSLDNYSAMEADGDVWGPGFSLSRDEVAILPLYQAVTEALGYPIPVMLSPWSPPAFMKTNGQKNHGGKLKPEYYTKWAEYLCRYIREYRARGVDVRRLSIQNEPNAVQTWDSCIYTAQEEKVFLRDHLYPALQKHGLTDVDIYIWDHNKERALERTQVILDAQTTPMVTGVAIHWYSGDHFDALRMIRERYPTLKLFYSEGAVEYRHHAANDYLRNARQYTHDIIGNLNAGLEFFMDWNILLDETGGPNHVGNFCDAPLMYDRKAKTLTKTLTYEYLAHLSRAIVPGSVRLGSSKFTEDIDATAFRRPDGDIAVALLNRTAKGMQVWIRMLGRLLPIELPGDSITTGVITG